MTGIRIAAVSALAMLAALAAAAAQAQEAGRVLFLMGEVECVSTDGAARRLSRGDAVRSGDILRTGPQSHVQLVMSDDALIALRPESSLHLQAYRYAGANGHGQAMMELLSGAFRSITGAIGHADKESYLIKTGPAVVGIRGTDHETFFVPAGSLPAEAGAYNRVTMGGTYLLSPSGRIDLGPGESGFAASRAGEAPVRLQRAPEFMYAAFAPAAFDTGPRMRDSSPGDAPRLVSGARADAAGGIAGGDARQTSGRSATAPGQAIAPGLAPGSMVDKPGLGKGRTK